MAGPIKSILNAVAVIVGGGVAAERLPPLGYIDNLHVPARH
jgi:hypothetical protein